MMGFLQFYVKWKLKTQWQMCSIPKFLACEYAYNAEPKNVTVRSEISTRHPKYL